MNSWKMLDIVSMIKETWKFVTNSRLDRNIHILWTIYISRNHLGKGSALLQLVFYKAKDIALVPNNIQCNDIFVATLYTATSSLATTDFYLVSVRWMNNIVATLTSAKFRWLCTSWWELALKQSIINDNLSRQWIHIFPIICSLFVKIL